MGQFREQSSLGKNNPHWKNGYIDKAGYKQIRADGRQIREHRYVMEKYLGRKLKSDEHIHHIDENKLNNSISNLTIMSNSAHKKLHLIKYHHQRRIVAHDTLIA